MTSRFRRLLSTCVRVVVGILVVAGFLVAQTRSATSEDKSVGLDSSGGPAAIRGPTTDGKYVAWKIGATSPATSCNTLKVVNLADRSQRTEVTIFKGATFAVSNEVVVWQSLVRACRDYSGVGDAGVYGLNLITGQQYVVTTDPAFEMRMVGSTVVWSVSSGYSPETVAIRMRDIDGGFPATIAEFPENTEVSQLRYDGERISWRETDEDQTYSRIMSVVPGDKPVELLATDGSLEAEWFDVINGWFFWQSGTTIQARNLTSGETRAITDGASRGTSTDGRYVLWVTQTDPWNVRLDAYDMATESQFVAASYTQWPESVEKEFDLGLTGSVIRGGIVMWIGYSLPTFYPPSSTPYYHELRAAFLSDVLPTAPLADPGTTDPNWTHYPETGHYLSFTFRDFWEGNGELPVFGYPLTEEYEERGFTSQFTERQRFEWHPENTGTPYEVLLGRLGDELLAAQERNWTTFPKAEPSAPYYFPETGHAIDERFWDHWSSHGLNLGEPGVSHRESLALFGYPLSEPMLETNADGDRVLTQYFERAVFEWHPDNPESYQVLLRRLGAEMLVLRGWLP